MAAVVLLTGVAVSIARCGREKEINAQVMAAKEEQTRQELRMQQEYGCDIYGQYEYPYNTMSQDWSGDQVEGFYYHEITEECKKAGGQFPVIMQVYTYIICEQNDVDYEMVFALIERESKCVWNAAGDGGEPVGLMQIAEKWQQERMKRKSEKAAQTALKDAKASILNAAGIGKVEAYCINTVLAELKRKGLSPEQEEYKRISRETARMVIRDRKGIWTRYYTDKEGLKDWLLWKLGLKKETVFDRMKRMGVTGDVLQDMELLTGGKKR